MHRVADWMLAKGYQVREPKAPRDILARDLSRTASEEYRPDPETGRSYRAYHAIVSRGRTGEQLTLWVDIEFATRKQMVRSVGQRREHLVGGAVQVTIDAGRWNRRHPEEDPITIPLDFGPDVEWELNAPADDKKAG